MKHTAKIEFDKIVIKLGFGDDFREKLAAIQALPDRRWNADRKLWIVPANLVSIVEDIIGREVEGKIALKKAEAQDESRKAEIVASLAGTKLFQYQKEGVAYLCQKPRALLADDMGLGKSCQAISMLKIQPEKLPALIVCPASLKVNWQREVKMWADLPAAIISGKDWRVSEEAQVVIVNYDILGKHIANIKAFQFNTLVIDECFKYDTLVTTNRGLLPIGYIVEARLDVSVLSYNIVSGSLDFMRILRYIKKAHITPLVKICHSGGEIVCTMTHKIWSVTHGKYKKADRISKGEELLFVRSAFPCKIKNIKTKVLREKLFGKMAYGATGNKRCHIHRGKATEGYRVKKEVHANSGIFRIYKTVIREDEKKQPNVRCRECKKNDAYKREKRDAICLAGRTWRERESHGAAENACRFAWCELGNRVSDRRAICNKSGIQHSDMLQGRYRESGQKNSCRSRWERSFNKKRNCSRFKKKFCIERVGVVSSTILELGDHEGWRRQRKEAFVYNLEVEINHNYFADGVLVSNCHYCKNVKTNRYKAVKACAAGIPYFVAMSGTPIENRPSEFFSTLNLIDPERFGSFWRFAQRYCDAKHNGFGWDFSGSSNPDELHELLNGNVMLRRKKEDVLTELPPKQRFSVPFDLPHPILMPDDMSCAPAIEQLNWLKQATARAKIEQAIEWLENMIESGNKIIAFAIHHEIVDAVMAHFGDIAVKLDGRDSQDQRNAAVDRFQNDETIRLFVGNIQAAGVGITLTKATHVAFLELDWKPGSHVQAEDRASRIGQTESVTCWYLIAADTIEEDIFDMLYKKKQVIDAVLDGGVSENESIIGALAKKYCGGKK